MLNFLTDNGFTLFKLGHCTLTDQGTLLVFKSKAPIMRRKNSSDGHQQAVCFYEGSL